MANQWTTHRRTTLKLRPVLGVLIIIRSLAERRGGCVAGRSTMPRVHGHASENIHWSKYSDLRQTVVAATGTC